MHQDASAKVKNYLRV